MELARFLAELHPVLVHFPIALWLAAVSADAFGFFRRDEHALATGKVLLVAGTVTALYATACGIFAETFAARAGTSHTAIETHERLALVVVWIFTLLTVARLYLSAEQRRGFAAYLSVGAAGCIALAFAAHTGGELVYRHGAAVAPAPPPPAFHFEELSALAQQQSPEDIRYSEFMHHVFGWIVLGLAFLLLAEALEWRFITRLQWLGPVMLLGGGVFLMIFSDTDSWPLSQQRPITDAEVLYHKIIATLLILAGVFGLRRRKSGARWSRHARLVALLALVGGSLLFTHLHTVAPYANVALGVYIHHTVMGTLALAIGAAKLIEEKFPRVRPARVAFPLLMMTESVFLIRYNEGMPWFLNYRAQLHDSPYGQTLANLGDARAALTFDPDTARLEVFALEPQENKPKALPLREARLLVQHGHNFTQLPLHSDDGARFVGEAEFLRHAQVFVAQLELDRAAAAFAGLRLRPRSYFEPWVAVPKNPLPLIGAARYHCPMHEHVLSHQPAKCPLCDMPLTPIRPFPDTPMHDAKYTMSVQSDPPPAAGEPTLLVLAPKQADGRMLTDLQVVHEKLLHLLIVRRDWSFFDHIHPVQQSDGKFLQPYTFPRGGEYLLFADLTPKGERTQVFRLPLTVAGHDKAEKPARLTPDSVLAREYGDVRVALWLDPRAPRARRETTLVFSLSRVGAPITDLRPWLGALGHCMALSEDTQTFLHFHPHTQAAPDGRVMFHAVFPRAGLYKLWAQFRTQPAPPESDEGILTADFILRIR